MRLWQHCALLQQLPRGPGHRPQAEQSGAERRGLQPRGRGEALRPAQCRTKESSLTQGEKKGSRGLSECTGHACDGHGVVRNLCFCMRRALLSRSELWSMPYQLFNFLFRVKTDVCLCSAALPRVSEVVLSARHMVSTWRQFRCNEPSSDRAIVTSEALLRPLHLPCRRLWHLRPLWKRTCRCLKYHWVSP